MHKRIETGLVNRIAIYIRYRISVGDCTPSWVSCVNGNDVRCAVLCNCVLLSCQYRRIHTYRSFARICNRNCKRIGQRHNVSGVECVIDPVLDWVCSLLAYHISVFTCKVESSRSCPVVRVNIRIEGGLSTVVVEEFDCECSAIDGGRPGDQVVDVPNLVDLSSSQNVGLVCERIWLFDCQSGRGTRVDEGHDEGSRSKFGSDCSSYLESVLTRQIIRHVDGIKIEVSSYRVKYSVCRPICY